MERLTEQERNSDGTAISKQSLIDRPGKGYPSSYCKRILNKLAEYEDLEEECIKETSWSLKILLKEFFEEAEDIQELYEYRELKKQGKLLKSPCAVGDIIWGNDFGESRDYIVTGFSFGELNDDCCTEEETFGQVIVYFKNSDGSITGSTPANNIGKSIFLTQEEAEAALKALKGSE